MMGFARPSYTELDSFRAYHIYVLWTSGCTRRNAVAIIRRCTTQCRIKINLYGFGTTPLIEKVELLAYIEQLGTNESSSNLRKRKKCMSQCQMSSAGSSAISISLENVKRKRR